MPSLPSKKHHGRKTVNVLDALGISLRTDSQGIRVISSDRRVQQINDLRETRVCLKPWRISKTNVDSLSGFQRACRQGNFSDVEFCLSRDPSLVQVLSTSSEDGIGSKASCVHFAVLGNIPEMVRYLSARGAPVSVRSERGTSPLHLACLRGYVECAVALFECGANVREKDNHGQTPISILKGACADAELRKNREIIRRRLEGSISDHSSITKAVLYKG